MCLYELLCFYYRELYLLNYMGILYDVIFLQLSGHSSWLIVILGRMPVCVLISEVLDKRKRKKNRVYIITYLS